MSRQEWRQLGLLAAVVFGLHLVGFGLLLAFVVPGRFELGAGSGAFGIGVGITAYTLGMRHAFDADHIGTIDNTTRKLMAEGQRPMSVGLFFSLGHSSIVVLLAVAIAAGARGPSGAVFGESSALQGATGLIGPVISGSFLLLVGALNLAILVGVFRVFTRMRHNELDEQRLEQQLRATGLMNRFLGCATRAVSKPWHMYPLGLLFGLGFDTATEVALLATAGTAAVGGLPPLAILCLPILFAAGMSLFDTLDGAFMNVAYGWALSKPVRRVFYNLVITGLSVAVALIVGSIELLGVLADELGLTGGLWSLVARIDLNSVGYALVAMFVLTWLVAVCAWRLGRIEERWSARLHRADLS